MYSLGSILYSVSFRFESKLVSGKALFSGKNVHEVTANNRRAKFSFEHSVWKRVSRSCKTLIAGLLCVDPAKRIDSQ